MRKPNLSFLDALPATCRSVCEPGKCGSAWSLFIEPGAVTDVARAMLAQGYALDDVSAVDVAEGIAVVYHFDHWDLPGRITVRAVVPFDNPVIDSIAAVYHGAEWHERESTDMLGVTFRGNPNPKPLLLPAEPEFTDFHPLRRQDPAELVPLLKMIPFCQAVDFPPDHPLVQAHKDNGAAEAAARKPAAKQVERKDEA
jgi:NADH-quinone oxidoreductase subunit C